MKWIDDDLILTPSFWEKVQLRFKPTIESHGVRYKKLRGKMYIISVDLDG